MVSVEIEKIGGSKPWIARITGTDPKFGLARQFVDGVADYSRANRPKTRGVYFFFTLDDGVYEVKGGASWGSANDRKFIRVSGDSWEKIDMPAVMQHVAAIGGAA